MLNELTPEQDHLLDAIAEEYEAELDAPRAPDLDVIRRWLAIVYAEYDKALPPIEVHLSPIAALAAASARTGQRETRLDYSGVADAGWVAFYDATHRLGVLSSEEAASVLALRNYLRVAWDSVLLDDVAIVVAQPLLIARDRDGNLHSSTGPAIRWRDGSGDWSWHGVWVNERMIMAPREYSREEFLAITDTEQRRALGESAGWGHITSLLGATVVDSWTDPLTGLAYDLLVAGAERWLQKQSPALINGSQPTYVEPVHEGLVTAQAARKWQATDLSPDQCEADPALAYGVES